MLDSRIIFISFLFAFKIKGLLRYICIYVYIIYVYVVFVYCIYRYIYLLTCFFFQLTEINQNLQKQIEALTNQNASSEGGMSPVEIQMLSQDRVDFMVKIEDLRKVIDSLHLENSNLTSSLKASEEMRQQMQSDFERLQKSCQQMSNDKDIILLESNSSQSVISSYHLLLIYLS